MQKRPKKLRATIKRAAPEAQETLTYRMPTFTLHGNLIHFAAYKHLIGLCPAPNGTQKFKKELSLYASAKGLRKVSAGATHSFRPGQQDL